MRIECTVQINADDENDAKLRLEAVEGVTKVYGLDSIEDDGTEVEDDDDDDDNE